MIIIKKNILVKKITFHFTVWLLAPLARLCVIKVEYTLSILYSGMAMNSGWAQQLNQHPATYPTSYIFYTLLFKPN